MHIKDKLYMERSELERYGPITIVVFGDSVTHGALSGGEINYDTVYWNLLRRKINAVRNYVPVNVINAAIGGTTAKESVARMNTQVLKHEPDLIIVCFGLNDVNGSLESFIDALKEIFARALSGGADVIYLSPNMLNTYVADDTEERYLAYAAKTAEMQNGGKMDLYISHACRLARKMGVAVCDCYAIWKEMSKTQDTTMMLCNRINHPAKEMHRLFADMLFDTIFGDDACVEKASDNTMYNKGEET